ncbi:N-acetylmuramoyl-L-alanine amidase [Natronobacillus azotifigens]|uniref:N-acetylmuramoyl-L-alanine amidase n=1 Tax=Natronobacillus azotifigens TaxID=472978 RepID=A0A9J6R927_9BACI|nr:N-acetylmuramoyl-L-alanine amidase [Natronobacillus azotifigens]MCZ0701785.1 N-acetylmuramoyl-L-alanine amidase [Natronobacillus azotifigens]
MKPILIIDPGHGGRDPGGGSNQEWLEKDFVLTISLYQYERYQCLGVPVAMTRTRDQTLTSTERTKRVRESGASFCHSNHINAGGGDGAEFIHSITNDGKHAEMLARHLKNAGQPVRRIFTRSLPNNSQRDFYFMNRETGNVATTIIEYGFADSTKGDQKRLKDNWKAYAEAIVEGFCQLINHPYQSMESTGRQRNNKRWYIGRRVESKVDQLRYYATPSWEDKALVNTINKGVGFPKIIDRISVGKGHQYQVMNSNGETYYITAHEKYVRVI